MCACVHVCERETDGWISGSFKITLRTALKVLKQSGVSGTGLCIVEGFLPCLEPNCLGSSWLQPVDWMESEAAGSSTLEIP